MTFTERPFLLFLLAIYAGWLLLRHNERRTVVFLLIASLGFYGHNHWKLLPLLVLYAVVNWAVARGIAEGRRLLALGVGFNLLTLGFFKYLPLLSATLYDLTGLGLPLSRFEGWQVPYGIAFYAFTGIAYMVDVHRRSHPAMASLGRYSLSAAFFPHLVAGPILRPGEFLNRLEEGKMPRRAEAPLEALALLGRGYFKKLVLADRLSEAIDPFFAHVGDATTAGVWSLPYVYLYALQIFFDFSAYTDIARGIAMLFGYRWPENFDRPYLATSVADFWRRWHITLSRFLRDYLYIPLGGSRGSWWATNRNLMLTMLLGGLWHGASWSFAVWGGLHGSYLVLHRIWLRMPLRARFEGLRGVHATAWKGFCILLTFHAVCLAWCFFRLTSSADAWICVRKAFAFDTSMGLAGRAYDPTLWISLVGYLLIMQVGRQIRRAWESSGHKTTAAFWQGADWGYGAGLILLAILLAPAGGTPSFIYFQF